MCQVQLHTQSCKLERWRAFSTLMYAYAGCVRLEFTVMVYCDVNWYSSDCSVYCKAVDIADEGHYSCDPDTGDKVCLEGQSFLLVWHRNSVLFSSLAVRTNQPVKNL